MATPICDSGRADSKDDLSFTREALPWLDDVFRFALSMTRNAADADDVVQETFLRAYRSWHTYQSGSDCRKWLFTICRNVFLRSREREVHKVEYGGSDAELETLVAVRMSTPLIQAGEDDLFSRLDVGPAIRQAIARLPDVFRSAVQLVDVEEMSYEEAAAILVVPVGTIRSRLFRGRRLLQEMLITHARDAGIVPREAVAHAQPEA
ncbi:MAG TPA: sigma-70 family RNA polymerase sigma factor [Gemmatimonadaceae bacterium]|jgi:RNA polymerase sigma-70 factor (ECF subfamily)|nr:sigma-70 family RNA polymerase sigma factor [Gemmatimonadaceae bacterium]